MLWGKRFRSVLVQSEDASMKMAVDIDLNPMRVGMNEESEDFRWSGYGESGPKRRNEPKRDHQRTGGKKSSKPIWTEPQKRIP